MFGLHQKQMFASVPIMNKLCQSVKGLHIISSEKIDRVTGQCEGLIASTYDSLKLENFHAFSMNE